jgi:1-acyl-sn-glycerol-3-phosphate acyltransferase
MINDFSYWVFRQFGWDIEGNIPKLDKFIIPVVPHTSNWDFIIGLMTKWSLNLQVNYIGKHELFRFPHGIIFRALGGRPVYRHKRNDLVKQVADIYKREKHFTLALAPEGTRSKVSKIKTGFYHIALEANIPIQPIGFDFSRKRIVVGKLMYPTGNKDKEIQELMDFYKTITPKYPELGIDENTGW